MTPYVVVEGEQTERRILMPWLEALYPGLSWADSPDLVSPGTGFLLASEGYPSIIDNVKAACEDINRFKVFDCFLIVCDSEDRPWSEVREEFFAMVSRFGVRRDCGRVVAVPNCCIETWLLGNTKFMPKEPRTDLLRRLASIYHVRHQDPEGLPAIDGYRNRADTHLKYLRAIFNDQGLPKVYRKEWVGHTADEHYLRSLIQRVKNTEHLRSFERFLNDLNDVFPITPNTPTPAAPPPSLA